MKIEVAQTALRENGLLELYVEWLEREPEDIKGIPDAASGFVKAEGPLLHLDGEEEGLDGND